MCVTFYPCKDPTLPGVYWRDNDAWRPYDAATTRVILSAAANGTKFNSIGSFTSTVYPEGATYELDLGRLEQRNVTSGQVRAVRFVTENSIKKLRFMRYVRVMEYITTEDYLYNAVTAKAAAEGRALSSVTRNPNLVTGSAQFNSFVESFSTLTPSEVQSVLQKSFNDVASAGTRKLELVFHGPRATANIDPILRTGMCPSKRKSNPRGEWFSRRLSTAFTYAAGKTVLAFLVLLDTRVTLRNDGDCDVIVMSDASYQLPVAQVVVS